MKAVTSAGRLAIACSSAAALLYGGTALAQMPCQGPGAPTNTETRCLTAIQIPGKPLRSFDISFVNPNRAEYYLADRSNAGIDVIDTRHNTFKRTIGGFKGIVNLPSGAVDNNHSGPDGVVTHGRWLYAGDADSTVHVIDLDDPNPATQTKTKISTGGTTRVDEMDITTDGRILLAANNAEDPPYGTLFMANGDDAMNSAKALMKVTVDATVLPATFGLSIEQPAWEASTKRFYVSIPNIANNPTGCNYGQLAGDVTCHGGLLVVDPSNLGSLTNIKMCGGTNTSPSCVIPLIACSPNGATVGPNANLLLGCTPQNNPSDKTTLTINAKTHNSLNINGVTGNDEVWYSTGNKRYYLGASRDCGKPAGCPAPAGGAVLGVVSADNLLIEKVPQSQASHSVAADNKRNHIYVPQVAPTSVVGAGGDSTTVGAGICGSTNGCIAVYTKVEADDDDGGGDHDGGEGHHHGGDD